MATFPYMPMVAIMASLISSLVMQMSAFSYAGYMVQYLGVVDDKDKAGYYAGLLSSAFMVGRLFSAPFWGKVADRLGCRCVMVVGLLSTAALSLGFGISTTFTWAFVCRFLLGLLNGITAASRTLVPQVCGTEHETVGMGLVTTSWSIGAVLGPGVGGLLAEPAKHHPLIFSEVGIFGRHPYLLPNVIGAGLALLALPLVLAFLKNSDDAASIAQTTKVWCQFGINDGDKHENGDDGAINMPAKTAMAVFLQSSSSTAKTPPRNTETTLLIGTRNELGEDSKNLGRQTGDSKRPSLLAQRHIRILLLIEGLFSVGVCTDIHLQSGDRFCVPGVG